MVNANVCGGDLLFLFYIVRDMPCASGVPKRERINKKHYNLLCTRPAPSKGHDMPCASGVPKRERRNKKHYNLLRYATCSAQAAQCGPASRWLFEVDVVPNKKNVYGPNLSTVVPFPIIVFVKELH